MNNKQKRYISKQIAKINKACLKLCQLKNVKSEWGLNDRLMTKTERAMYHTLFDLRQMLERNLKAQQKGA
jgi:hypothetical protein